MRRLFPLFLVALTIVSAKPLRQGERDRALSDFHATRAMYLHAVENLTDAQWNFKPAPETIAALEQVMAEAGVEPGAVDAEGVADAVDPDTGGVDHQVDDALLQLVHVAAHGRQPHGQVDFQVNVQQFQLVAAQGGNAGNQTMTIVVRSLALGEIESRPRLLQE